MTLSISAGSDEVLTDRTPFLKPLYPAGDHVTIPAATHVGILFDETVANRITDFCSKLVDPSMKGNTSYVA